MRKGLVAAALAAWIVLLPADSVGTPTTPELTPANGCLFAQAVLEEIDKEEARILTEGETATQPRKVVITVHKLSGANLRKRTQEWIRGNCLTS